jgi:hypothetical protein
LQAHLLEALELPSKLARYQQTTIPSGQAWPNFHSVEELRACAMLHEFSKKDDLSGGLCATAIQSLVDFDAGQFRRIRIDGRPVGATAHESRNSTCDQNLSIIQCRS